MNIRHFAIPRHHLDIGLLIGALAGVAGIGFHFLADRFGALLFGWIETNQAPISLLLVILAPTIGLCLVGLILQKVPASTLCGVREVSQALDNYGVVIPLSPRSMDQVKLYDFGLGGEGSYSLRLHSAMMLSWER
jgi:H+/Cl- antiporter ClcA